MDIRDLKKEIEITFEALEEQVKNVLETEGKIPQIDMDILLGSLRKIYEDVRSLEKINDRIGEKVRDMKAEQPTIPKTGAKEEKAAEKKEISEEKPVQPEAGQDRPVELKAKEEKEEKKESEPAEEKQQSFIPEKGKSDKVPPAEKQQRMTVDLFGDHTTLADKFMDKKDETLAARIKQNKIDDLKKAIGINEKFLFIHELFDGNMNEYNNIIEQLNSMGSLQDAIAFLERLKEKHDWSGKPSYLQLKSLVEKRY